MFLARLLSMSVTPRAKPWLKLYGDRPETFAAPDGNMLDVFDEAVRRRPTAYALRYFDAAWRYDELDHLGNQAARLFAAAGVTRGDRVAIILQNIPQFAAAVLGCWKLGAVPTPCNPMYSERELTILFADSRPAAFLCQNENASVTRAAALQAGLPQRSVLTTSPAAWQSRDDLRVLPHLDRDDMFGAALRFMDDSSCTPVPLASSDPGLLMYTSGTTGKPKAAVLSHGALAYNAETSRIWFDLHDGCGALCIAPLFHITGFECDLCAVFRVAGELVLSYRFHPDVMLEALIEHRPSFAIGAITAFSALAASAQAGPPAFESLRQVYSGGAPVSPILAEAFLAKTGRALLPCYGMTETAAPTHVAPSGHSVPVDPASGAWSIGVPTSDVEVRLVDDHGVDVACGEPGEMLLRGRQVMDGYWRRIDDTAATLEGGWLRTGDVAVMDQNGWFYLVDRKKDVIIASGFKVWPREVEEVLYGHGAVREAAVIGVPDSYRGETVKAFLSLKPGSDIASQDLLDYCRERLAAYKVPRLVEILDDLPKTASGKITRAVLRERSRMKPSE